MSKTMKGQKIVILAIFVILGLQYIVVPTEAQTKTDCEPTDCEPVVPLTGTVSCFGANISNPNNFQAHIQVKVDGKVVIDNYALSNQTTFFAWPEPYIDRLTHRATLLWWAYCECGTYDLGEFGPCVEEPPSPPVGGVILPSKYPSVGLVSSIILTSVLAGVIIWKTKTQ